MVDTGDKIMGRTTHPKAFISYSWANKARAIEIADLLIQNGIQVVIDVYDLREGMDKYAFMQRIVDDDSIEKVLVLCDKSYRDKANKFKGGVGDEAMIISPEIYSKVDQEKFIPVVIEYEDGKPCLPTFAKSRIYVDLANPDNETEEFERLVRNLWGYPDRRRPPLGNRPSWLDIPSVNTSVLHEQVRAFETTIRLTPNPDSILHKSAFEITKILNEMFSHKKEREAFNLIDAIKNTEAIRNSYIDIVERFMQTDDFSGDKVGSLIEEIYNGIVCRDSVKSECYYFFFWDIFISTSVLFICYEKFEALHELLNRTYFLRNIIGSNNDPEAYSFSRFRHYMGVLEYDYKPKINDRLVSLAADILIKREYGACITKQNLVTADTTLAHLAKLYGKTEYTWYPALAPYSMYAGYCLMWERLPSKSFCKKIFPLFGVKTFDEFRLSIKTMSDAWRADKDIQQSSAMFGGIHPILRCGDFEKIGTMP
ncbi:MAG: toll/interleukin-1 receptor domain-containing protein [Kiritimatiellia bacterium]